MTREVGLAFISQQPYKAEMAMSTGELANVRKKWIRAGDGPEPKSPHPHEIGPGKLANQLTQPDVESQLLAIAHEGVSWISSNLDVSFVHAGLPISKPEEDLHIAVHKMGMAMLHGGGHKRELQIDNIVAADIPGAKDTAVIWRTLGMALPESLIRLIADPGEIEKYMDKGWIGPDFMTPHSNAGIRWDHLPLIWPWLKNELHGSRAGKDLRLMEVRSGRTVVVDDKESASTAGTLMRQYTRGVVPGILGELIGKSRIL